MDRPPMEDRESDLRLIEAGFPCHQVGAETQRERGASSALPPLYFLHVWWARRPLTPSRAAILASLLPADADTDTFLRDLGIERVQVNVNGVWWTIDDVKLKRLEEDADGREWYRVDHWTLKWLEKENEQRQEHRELIRKYRGQSSDQASDYVLDRWEQECQPIPGPFPGKDDLLPVRRVAGDPAWAGLRIEWEKAQGIRTDEDKYKYPRAYKNSRVSTQQTGLTVLDPTAGGGSIPFEALRLGHRVIANELNPVAAVILKATLDYPARYGAALAKHIARWGGALRETMVAALGDLFPASAIPASELARLEQHLRNSSEDAVHYSHEQLDGFIYARQVTCPHCRGEAPLLNTCWLSKQDGDRWGGRIIPDGKKRGGTVRFATYRVKGGSGPNGEDPDSATVDNAVGTCIHCRQAISADEIKRQARGESPHGTWSDRLYCVVAVRYQPKLDRNGRPQRYKSGEKKGQIKTEKITFFRPPNERDLQALREARGRLEEQWPEWERQGLIPTENIPEGHKTAEPLRVGMTRWCDMFTPRQLLGHVTLVEELNRLKPQILEELGEEKGKAVVTYLQFAIDKGVDYNSKQTRWEYTRGIVKGAFGRADFSVKWTFGEMIFTGPNSGAAWGLSQILDAYAGLADLTEPLHDRLEGAPSPVEVLNRTAAHMPEVADASVELVCMDPPYYNNRQYAELSDYFYVWQKRTLYDLFPGVYGRRLTNKTDEAVANPARDGGTENAKARYRELMAEIFEECRRVLKPGGLLTLMFTHKTQEAWETLTRSLIEHGWEITATFPVESESAHSMHQMGKAAAQSSVYLACRPRTDLSEELATWSGFGGEGVQQRVREAVREGLEDFQDLKLSPVDEMVASYGRALRVLSRNWPVMDGDEEVSPIRAMNEASRVVAEHQIARITDGRLQVADLNPEAAMALTLYGIYGLVELPYDDALNLSRSLRIGLQNQPAGYRVQGRMVGVNQESRGEGEAGYHAPVVRSGSKLRLALPCERHPARLKNPQTEWDLLHGLIRAYREGDVPVARAYLQEHADGREQKMMDLLEVWTAEMADQELHKEGRAILFGLEGTV